MTERWELHEMDCRLAMAALMDENSVDSIVCDPPYGLSAEPDAAEVLRHWLAGDDYKHGGAGFMGKSWDSFVPGPSVWREAYRVLKPGGYLVAFFGTRTYDLGCMAIRLAGFEIRDQLEWIYGSGFPKSLDVSKAIDKAAGAEREVVGPNRFAGTNGKSNLNTYGAASRPDETAPATDAARAWQGWGTALKPAHEPIVLARKPLAERTVAANVLAYGTGGLHIDACRVGDVGGGTNCSNRDANGKCLGHPDRSGDAYGLTYHAAKTDGPLGRFPPNVLHDGSDEVLVCFPDTKSGVAVRRNSGGKNFASEQNKPPMDDLGYADGGGSAARFYPSFQLDAEDQAAILYCAKASKRDRNSGLDSQRIVSIERSTWENVDQLVKLRVDTAQSPIRVIGVSGTRCASPTEWNSALFGNASAGQFQTDMTSITATETNSIIQSTISNCLQKFGTSANTVDANKSTEFGKNHAENAANICPKKVTISEKTAYLLGADLAAFKTPLKISVSDGNSDHPTVKPTPLMRWLCRLVTPPGGTVFDPFTGSGSTGKAAMVEGFSFVGCEMDATYAEIARARIAAAATTARPAG